MRLFSNNSVQSTMFAPILACDEQITLFDSNDFKQQTSLECVGFAALQANRFIGSRQMLPSQTVSPTHVKSADKYDVVLRAETTHNGAFDFPQAQQ